MKRLTCMIIIVLTLITPLTAGATDSAKIYPFEYAFEEFWYTESAVLDTSFPVKAALLMEASTGKILFAQDEDKQLPIASVTKIMSTLLIMEALDNGKISLDDKVTVGADAAGMGGSQVYLEVGETMYMDDMLKSLIVVSANDATVALAEHLSGSEESFVALMNERAAQLGMKNTHFSNCHGLTEENHYSSAYDVALMTQELLKHEKIFDYTTIWMDTIRDGAFGLANTNKLIRFYSGANGMKTGFTGDAKYCLSGTAKRDGMQLIAVVIGAETSEERFAVTKKMLDFGFANYFVVTPEKLEVEPIKTTRGLNETTAVEYNSPAILTEKGKSSEITAKIVQEENISAPIEKGDILGEIVYYSGENIVARAPLYAAEDNPEVSFWDILGKLFKKIIGK